MTYNCANCNSEIKGVIEISPYYGKPFVVFEDGQRLNYCDKPGCQQAGYAKMLKIERTERAQEIANPNVLVDKLNIPHQYIYDKQGNFKPAQLNDRKQLAKGVKTLCLNSLGGVQLLYGRVGVGKTRYLYAIKIHCYVLGVPCWLDSFVELVSKWEASKPWEAESIARQIMQFEGLMLIDDLGSERRNDKTIDQINAIIHEREKWSRRTLITSNYDVDKLSEIYGSRTFSRLSGGRIVEFTGEDRRGK